MLNDIYNFYNTRPKYSPMRHTAMSYLKGATGFGHTRSEHNSYAGIFGEYKRDMKRFGRNLAASGILKDLGGKPVHAYPDKVKSLMEFVRNNCGFATLRDAMQVFMPDAMRLLRERETKMDNSEWSRVPWADEMWFLRSPYYYLHALHMSQQTPGNVAFAQTVEKGLKDQFTSAKPGRYLTRFFGDVLSEDQIRDWAEKCAASILPAELHFIESNDPKGWVHVYENGPYSCMQGNDSVRVYAHEKSVLRLAYLKQGETITARCIVRDDTNPKEYVRVYPNTDSPENQTWHARLKSMLEDAGYVRGSLDGALLRVIEADEGRDSYVMPYLDHGISCSPHVSFTTDKDGFQYFRVCKDGDYAASSTEGYIRTNEQMRCEHCDGMFDEEDLNYLDDQGHICNGCLEEYFVEARHRGRGYTWMLRDDAIYCESNDEYYTEDGAEYHNIIQCEDSGAYYELDEMVQTSRGWYYQDARCIVALDEEDSDGNSYAHKDDTVTTHDGRTIHKDDAVTVTLEKIRHKDDEPLEGEE